MIAPLKLDVDDTTRCPVAAACEGDDCGSVDDLAVATVQTTLGVQCATLCSACVQGLLPALSLLEALTRAGQHAEHLGTDIDTIAAAHVAEASR